MIPIDINPEKMGVEEGLYHKFNFNVAEAKFIEYQNEFDRVKKIKEPDVRKTELEKLLEKYSNDRDIIKLANIYTLGIKDSVEIEKIDELVDLKYNIFDEITGKTDKLKSREGMLSYLEELNNLMNKDPLMGITSEAYQHAYGTLDADDLRKQFTI